jgi:hypothetical protein
MMAFCGHLEELGTALALPDGAAGATIVNGYEGRRWRRASGAVSNRRFCGMLNGYALLPDQRKL